MPTDVDVCRMRYDGDVNGFSRYINAYLTLFTGNAGYPMSKKHTSGYQPPKRVARVRNGYTLNGKLMRGVVETCRRLWYPSYTYESAVHGPIRAAPPADKRRAESKDSGKSRGSAVDHQITSIVHFIHTYCIDPRWMLFPESHRSQLDAVRWVDKADKGRFWRLLDDSMHVFCRTFLNVLVQKQWLPISTQIICASSEARLATAVDVVAFQKGNPNQHILLEIKCGYYKYLKRYSQSHMLVPFQAWNDCPLHQFYLQLSMTRRLYERTYRLAMPPRAYVVVMHEHGADVYELPASFYKCVDSAWRYLVATKKETSRDRSRARKRAATAVIKHNNSK